MTIEPIYFNWTYSTGKELLYAAEAQRNHHLSGDGPFTKRCHQWIERRTGCAKALLTHSCTSALDLAALVLDIEKGDEVILPSYTFVSTANAFVLRGAVPVFVDIREDTLNLDEQLIEAAITPRTRAIVPVHYAGVSCEMDSIDAIAKRHNLKVVEDAAQGIMASYKGRALGAIGDLGSFSFHETKNIISGEGGSLLVNDPKLASRAEIVREKGTDRGRFHRGEVDKYTWQDVGSSFLPSEITAAFLWAQFEEAEQITKGRLLIWQRYHEMLAPLEQQGLLRRPVVPPECQAQRPYVLHATCTRNRSANGSERIKAQPDRGGLSLRSVAFVSCRNAFRASARRPLADDVVIAAVDPTANVVWLERAAAAAGRWDFGRYPSKAGVARMT